MAKKSKHDKLIDDAIKSGDWGAAETASNRDLRQLGAKLLAGHNLPQHDTRDILPDDLPEDDTPSEELEESVDPDLDLGDIETEEPFECLRDACEAYSKAGGNRCIREKVLRYFDAIEIKAIDRTVQRKAAEELFPDFGEHIWDDEIFDPITEVRKFWFKQRALANGHQWCAPDYHDSGARYPRAWGINQGYRGFRDGREPPLFQPGMRVRHLTGQRRGRVPDVDCIGTRWVRILRERPWSTDQWLEAGASFWEQSEVLPKGSDRVALEPYCQWVPQDEAKGPHPFEVRIAREEEIKRLPPPVVNARTDAAEAAAERDRQLARLEAVLDSTLGSKITHEQARLICKRDQLVPARHDAPLPFDLAKPTTPKQWEDYRLAQYTTACGELRFGMSPRVPIRKASHAAKTGVPKAELRALSDMAVEKFLSEGGSISVLPTYYGYDAMGRKRGRPRKPKLKLVRSVGRPRLGEEVLTDAEKQQRYRDKKRNLRLVAGVTRVHFMPRLQAWMCAHLKEETLLLCNMRKAA